MFHVGLYTVEHLLKAPTSCNKPDRRWHLAFITIYCSRAILSLHKKPSPKKQILLPHSPSYTVIDLKYDTHLSTVDQRVLTELVKEKDLDRVIQLGGIEGLASSLHTNLENGIQGGSHDIERRVQSFGSNTYKKPPTKSFFYFVVEAFKDLTIVILLACATLSLGFGIKEHGLKEGWYDGGSIFLAVFLVIAVSSVSNYRQNRQFEKLSKVSNNIKIDVLRKGRRQSISIFEIVVGDVVCLKIGDQVSADGLFINGHSLRVDESSMTGESDHVEVDGTRNPFMYSGTKIIDGYGTMMVTSVGMNTMWGQMMSSISQDNNDRTPLQSRLDKLTASIGKQNMLLDDITVSFSYFLNYSC